MLQNRPRFEWASAPDVADVGSAAGAEVAAGAGEAGESGEPPVKVRGTFRSGKKDGVALNDAKE